MLISEENVTTVFNTVAISYEFDVNQAFYKNNCEHEGLPLTPLLNITITAASANCVKTN